MDREELVNLKKEQIRLLKAELELIEGKTIRSYAKGSIIYSVYNERENGEPQGCVLDARSSGSSEVWDYIRLLSQTIFMEKESYGYGGNKERYRTTRRKQSDLTPEQLKLAAQFCDEVIDTFNRYVKKANPIMDFYGANYTPWKYLSEQE